MRALRGIDLEIYEREFVVLLGPSGSGKSTLLNILGGLETGVMTMLDNEEQLTEMAEVIFVPRVALVRSARHWQKRRKIKYDVDEL